MDDEEINHSLRRGIMAQRTIEETLDDNAPLNMRFSQPPRYASDLSADSSRRLVLQ